jgi:hypothetical protein
VQPETTGAKRKPELNEATFQRLLADAYLIQGHNDRLLAKRATAQALEGGSEEMPGIVTTSVPVDSRSNKSALPSSAQEAMQEALELLKPELERLLTSQIGESFDLNESLQERSETGLTALDFSSATNASITRTALPHPVCRSCGQAFDADESFCGICGTPRHPGSQTGMQRNRSSAYSQPAPELESGRKGAGIGGSPLRTGPSGTGKGDFSGRQVRGSSFVAREPEPLPPELEAIIAHYAAEEKAAMQESSPVTNAEETAKLDSWTSFGDLRITPSEESQEAPAALLAPAQTEEKEKEEDEDEGDEDEGKDNEPKTILAEPLTTFTPARAVGRNGSPWNSALGARIWLESLKKRRPSKLWLASHRANIYLIASAILLLIVLSGWGIPSSDSGQQRGPAKPRLTFFQTVLVDLGLAEVQPAPVYSGNPNTPVWVDLHTALYYCPGAELYGKTERGRTETQREAQEDQFEPASRKTCD